MKILTSFLVAILFFSTNINAQARLYARTNLQLATDAEVYWAGPQVGVGLGVKWPSGLGLVSEYYGFRDKVDKSGYGWFEKGCFRQKTLAIMGTYSFGKSKEKGFYLMAGMAYQSRRSEFENEFGLCPYNMDYFTPAFEFGRRWPVSKNGYGIAASIKFTGPISYDSEPHIELIDIPESNEQYPYYVGTSSTLEVLTQLSIGVVVDRIFPVKRGKGDR